MAIQVRRGKEDELDISKAVPGEWLVSTDTRIVRMCVAPGIVLRMATYEAFEADTQKFIEQMEQILSETKTVQEAVERIQNEIEDSVITVENYVESAKGYSNLSNTYAMQSKMYAEESNNYADDSYNEAERAKMYAENAEAVTNVKIASQTEAGLMRGGENYVAEDGTLQLTAQTTDSILKNSHAGSIKINEVLGNCEQTQYTGKNLLDCSGFTEKTINGVTITPVYDDNGNLLYIGVNGTATNFVFLFINASSSYELKAGTYILSGCPSGGGATTYEISIYSDKTNYIQDYGNTKTFTLDADTTFTVAQVIVRKGSTVNNLRFYPMIRLASVEDDTYEPYVGGIPSPNPDYPQEIQSVEVSEIKAHGKNFIPYPYYEGINSDLKNGITYTDNGDGSVTADGTATAESIFRFSVKMSEKVIDRNTNYFLSGCPSGGSEKTFFLRFAPRNSSNNNIRNFDDIGDGKLIDVSDTLTGVDRYAAYIIIRSGTTVSNLTFRPQLELGDAATDYEPYQESVVTLSEAVTLHGIDDVKDRIVRKDGVLCIERNCYDFTLDGSETWTLGSVDNLFRTTVVAGISPKAITAMLSDSYICSMQSVANMPDKTIRQSVTADSTTAVAHIKDSSYTTVDELTAALAENPVRCIVMRAEPTYESLPTADQIALMSLKTFDTVTYISTDSDIEPVIEVEYGTSRIGGYTLEALNTAQKNEIQYASLATLTNSLATALVAGSEE